MRIGVNALYLIPGGVGGTEIYLRSLLEAMAEADRSNEWLVITNQETGSALAPPAPNFRVLPQAVRAMSRPSRLLWEQTSLPSLARDLKLDVLLNPGFTAPLFAPCPMVTVFHDLQHKRHPEYFRWFDRAPWRFFLYWAARRSTRLIAVSEATRADLLRFYPWLNPGAVAVVPHGVSPEFFALGPSRATDRFLLCVSTLHPHKNIERLIGAFRRAGLGDCRLVIAGLRGFHTAPIERAIEQAGLGNRVRLTGWISREELLALYRDALAAVYPSTFEGFGMPVLEALAAGLPLAVSDIEPMKGIAGDAALRFDPSSEAAIAEALVRIASDEPLRARLKQAGPERARQFTWHNTAKATLAALTAAGARR